MEADKSFHILIMATTTTKPFWQSKTLIGLALAAGGYFLSKWGVPVTPAANSDFNQIQTYIEQIKQANGSFTAIAGTIITAAGFITALYGRIVSETKLTLKK